MLEMVVVDAMRSLSSGAYFASRWRAMKHLRRRHLLRPLRRFHRKALIALGRDFVADLAIDADPADIGHEDLRLAGDVGAHVPGVGLRIERGVRDLVHVRHPFVLGFFLRLYANNTTVAHITNAVADPVNMLFD